MFWLTLILVLLHLTRGKSPCFGRSLGISPCRTQFFKREGFTLYCGADERIMTNSKSVTCSQKSHECNITLAGEHNSGSYWCGSNSGERGEVVNITVTAGSVILESPVHPVPEGSPVTLRCLMSHKSSKKLVVVTRMNQSCTFSRDGRSIGVGLTGEMSFAAVNRSHEGLYTCTFSGVESPGSWLAVRGDLLSSATSSTEPPPPHQSPPAPPIGLRWTAPPPDGSSGNSRRMLLEKESQRSRRSCLRG
ncbi:high affinity immunoglobulin gamma Fc receptor I-like [Gadus chalcogrammus]|uniref:high affinity immunoglobulin gamma Fc receptor I-like n=1 Tax=Gadus chalcogrammus TaxID=1042646 RepID=UPI0024C4A577|nr:high affinity immunoglobulin gamma Fc receptor I-like [Gadus chalcogrammus]